MLDELRSWWQNLSPESQTAAWDGGVAVAAFFGGLIAGAIARRTLRSWNFDAAFDLSGGPPPGAETGRRLTPTRAVGLLVRLTVWAAAAWWLLGRYGRPDLAESLRLVGGRVWALLGILAVALVVGGLLARRAADCLSGPLNGWNPAAARNGATQHRAVAGAVGLGVYGLVLLLTLLTAADLFDWPLTRSAATALWQLAQQLLTAGGAVLLAVLGARWARDLAAAPAGPVSPVQRAGQYVGLTLVGGTTIGAVAALLSVKALFLGVAGVGVLGFLLWVARGYLPDVLAGRKLRADKVGQVWIEGSACRVAGVGLLTAEVGVGGETGRVPNRTVLEAAGARPAGGERATVTRRGTGSPVSHHRPANP